MKHKPNTSIYLLLTTILSGCQSFTAVGNLEGLECEVKDDVRLCEKGECTGTQVCETKLVWGACECPSDNTGGAGGEISGVGGESTLNHIGGSDTGGKTGSGASTSIGGSMTGSGGFGSTTSTGGIGSGGMITGGSATGGNDTGGSNSCIPKTCEDLTRERTGRADIDQGSLGSTCGSFGELTDGCGHPLVCNCDLYLTCGGDVFKNPIQPTDNIDDITEQVPNNVCGGGCINITSSDMTSKACSSHEVSSKPLFGCNFGSPYVDEATEQTLKINEMKLLNDNGEVMHCTTGIQPDDYNSEIFETLTLHCCEPIAK